MRGLLEFLFRRGSVLVGFLLLKAAAVLVNGLASDSGAVWGLGILALLVYAVIAWFAHTGRLVSIWAITVLMLYEGAGALLLAWSSLGSAPGIAAIGLCAALYLILGALVVFSSRRRG